MSAQSDTNFLQSSDGYFDLFDTPEYHEASDGVKELIGYASLAKLMMAEAIKDLNSNNKDYSVLANKWLFDDNYNAQMSLTMCCDIINSLMEITGKHGLKITASAIRNRVMRNEGRKNIMRALRFSASSGFTDDAFESDSEMFSFFGYDYDGSDSNNNGDGSEDDATIGVPFDSIIEDLHI